VNIHEVSSKQGQKIMWNIVSTGTIFHKLGQSLVTFNIQNFSDGIYLKDFFSTFSQWVWPTTRISLILRHAHFSTL
jgi:hypothetical protein